MAVSQVLTRRLVLLDLAGTRSRPCALIFRRHFSKTNVERCIQNSFRRRHYYHHNYSYFQRSQSATVLLKSQHSRQTNTMPSPVAFMNTHAAGSSSQDVPRDNLDLSFTDHQAAYRSYTTGEILRAWLVYNLCEIQYLVKHNRKLMKFGRTVLGQILFEKCMKMTFYGHFVAGENQVAIRPRIEKMRSFGVKSILDYSVEEDITEEQAEKAEMDAFKLTKIDRGERQEDEDGGGKNNGGSKSEDTKGFSKYRAYPEFADRRKGTHAARTYFYMGEAACEKNMEIFLEACEAVSGATKGTGFAAIKMTALGRPEILLQLSEVIARVHRYVSGITGKEGSVLDQNITPDVLQRKLQKAATKDPTVQKWLKSMTSDSMGLIHVLPWGGVVDAQQKLQDVMKLPNPNTGEMQDLLPVLTDAEEEMFRNMMRRLHTIFKVAKKLDVRVMVDAEQTYFQPAISRLTMEMARIYNKEKAIVFNTYQCYLKDALKNLKIDLRESERQNFFFGCKLVRGAYMVQERARAEELGYEDPINPDYAATSEMYEGCLQECFRRIKKAKEAGRPQQYAIMAATHNEDTVRFAIQKMKDFGIGPSDRVLCFGQLYGMCDQVSYPLGQSGYSVYKYTPYGPVEGVMPYLSRRAEENGSMLTKIGKEKKMLIKELGRRMFSGQLLYKPEGKYEPF